MSLSLVIQTVQIQQINHAATGAEARAIRLKHNLTLEDVSREMGVSFPYLATLEYGKRTWREDLVDGFNEAIEALTSKEKR